MHVRAGQTRAHERACKRAALCQQHSSRNRTRSCGCPSPSWLPKGSALRSRPKRALPSRSPLRRHPPSHSASLRCAAAPKLCRRCSSRESSRPEGVPAPVPSCAGALAAEARWLGNENGLAASVACGAACQVAKASCDWASPPPRGAGTSGTGGDGGSELVEGFNFGGSTARSSRVLRHMRHRSRSSAPRASCQTDSRRPGRRTCAVRATCTQHR